MSTLGTLSCYQVYHPRYWDSWEARYGSWPYLHLSLDTGMRNRTFGGSYHTQCSLTLNPSHPDQLLKHHKFIKRKDIHFLNKKENY